MSLTTVTVSIVALQATGAPLPNGSVVLELTAADISGGLIAPEPIPVALDANGLATVSLMPNSLGSQGTQYRVTFFDKDRQMMANKLATIPNSACNLHECFTNAPAVLSDAQAALSGAQAAEAAAQISETNAATSAGTATTQAGIATTAANTATAVLSDTGFVAVKNDLPNIDTVATNISSVNSAAANMPAIVAAPTYAAGAAASDADATQQANAANGFALTAAASAAQAYAYMQGAASVAQQDLSLVAKQIHFSPNAILGTLVYDTSRDSNPGWVDQVQHTGYYRRQLNGAWLVPNLGGGGFPNELTARYVVPNAAEGVNWSVGNMTVLAGAGGYVQNDGTSGRYISVPHSTTNAPSGTIDITCAAKANLPSWTALAANFYFGSTGFAGNGGVALVMQTTGKMQLVWGNGTTTPSATSTAALTQGANTDLWVAGRLQCNNGGVYTVTFWYSTDGVTWTQLGAAVNGAGPTTVVAAGNPLVVGANSAGTSAINGKLYAYQMLLNGLPGTGTVISKFDGNAITANATGSYFQLATDGRHYSLNAGSGITATYDGNTAKPPREWGFVWEASYLSIYALDQPGCPMWMSFLTTNAAPISALGASAAATLASNSVRFLEGKLYIGSNQGGLIVDFANDEMTPMRSATTTLADRSIAARNSQPAAPIAGVANGVDYMQLGSNSVNCITACVYPDAPVNPNTGLMQPTVFVGSASPCTLIKDDGSAPVTTTNAAAVQLAAITPWYLLMASTANAQVLYVLGNMRGAATNFSVTTLAANANQFTADTNVGLLACNRSLVAKFNNGPSPTGPAVDLMRFNASNPLASLFARITPYSNTGWMVGDIRGCWLSSTVSGTTVAGANLITDGTFDNAGTSALYGLQDGNISDTVSGGSLNVSTNASAGSNYVYYTATTEPGVQYTVAITPTAGTGATGGYLDVRDGIVSASGSGTQLNFGNGNYSTATAVNGTAASTTFVAISNKTILRLSMVKTQNAAAVSWDNFSCTVTALADRCYKGNNLTLFGSITKAAANTATQIMLYSGWSAANYAQQAYNASLDPGTGAITESIWGTIPANVAAAGTAVDRSAASGAYYTFGHDATGHLTATVSDGTTTRTVTTTQSFATGVLFKARMLYSPSGTLSISVNSAVVASQIGTPLGSLSNASAVLTVGNNRALAQPWAGSLALARVGMTLPTPEQSSLCFEQEKMMFEAGAVSALGDATTLQDHSWDALQGKLKIVSSGYENSLTGGITFSAQAAVSQGSFTRCAHASGIKLTARSTTNPGVDVMIPPYGLREEMANRDRAAAERAHLTLPLDYSGGFTATEASGSTNLTSVSGWTFPSQSNQRGIVATEPGGGTIPANATITDYSGTSAWLSAAATGTGSKSIALTGFRLPQGYEAMDVSAGAPGSLAVKTEGASNDYTRLFDGFCETVLFGTAPGATAKVRIDARRWLQ